MCRIALRATPTQPDRGTGAAQQTPGRQSCPQASGPHYSVRCTTTSRNAGSRCPASCAREAGEAHTFSSAVRKAPAAPGLTCDVNVLILFYWLFVPDRAENAPLRQENCVFCEIKGTVGDKDPAPSP